MKKLWTKGSLFLGLALLVACGDGWFDRSLAVDVPERVAAELTRSEQFRRPGSGRGDFVYLVMADRFANGDPENDYGDYVPSGADPDSDGEVLKHGFKKNNKAYYHGGDLAGLTHKLGYLKRLGVTAVWLTPIFVNDPVQGNGTVEGSSSGYHGYWITDFLRIDPHLGSEQEFACLVRRAHALGIKIILDIVVNHTGDIVQYAEGVSPPYVLKVDVPYRDIYGEAFDDADFAFAYQNNEPFPELDLSSFPYTPIVPDSDRLAKNPAWLNNPLYYHNRGSSTFAGESSAYGDVHGLDDLFTEHPQVVAGMLEVYRHWITTYGVDGYRLDTAKHVNDEFWQQFVPRILDHAEDQGVDFRVFGEVFDGNPEVLSRYTTKVGLPAVLDFGFQGTAAAVASGRQSTDGLRHLSWQDDYYLDTDSNAYSLPTFLGNHDVGRIGAFVKRDNPEASETELLARARLAHFLLFTWRGVPTIYYGDEQGFTGVDGTQVGDKIARQDMFPSAVPLYGDPEVNRQIGSATTPADSNFDVQHPLYRSIRAFAFLRRRIPALSTGTQIHRFSSADPDGGLYVFSRLLKGEDQEFVIAVNTHPSESRAASVDTFHPQTLFLRLYPLRQKGKPLLWSDAKGTVELAIPPLGFALYKALAVMPDRVQAPEATFVSPVNTYNGGRFWLQVELDDGAFAEVAFYADEPTGGWRHLGTDDNPPYRVRYDSAAVPNGSVVDLHAVVTDHTGNQSHTMFSGVTIENRRPQVTVVYQNGHQRDGWFAIDSLGKFTFPGSLAANAAVLDWPLHSDKVTLFFDSRQVDNTFLFDQPIELRLFADILPHAVEDESGQLRATVYVNNQHEISGTAQPVDELPVILPDAPNAEAPLPAAVYIRGGLNGWGTRDELSYLGSYSYQKVVAAPKGHTDFKFADATWAVFNYGAPFSAHGLELGANPGALSAAFPENGCYETTLAIYPPSVMPPSGYSFFRLEPMACP